MDLKDLEFSIAKLDLAPTDKLIFKFGGRPSEAALEKTREVLERFVPGGRALLIGSDVEIIVVRLPGG